MEAGASFKQRESPFEVEIRGLERQDKMYCSINFTFFSFGAVLPTKAPQADETFDSFAADITFLKRS